MGQQRRPQQLPRRRQRVHRHNGRGRRGVPAEGRGDAERDAARERARPHAERGGVVAEGGVGGGGERGVDGPPMRDRPGPGRRAVRERRQSERAEVAAGAVDGGRGAAGGEAVAEVQAEGEGRGVAEGGRRRPRVAAALAPAANVTVKRTVPSGSRAVQSPAHTSTGPARPTAAPHAPSSGSGAQGLPRAAMAHAAHEKAEGGAGAQGASGSWEALASNRRVLRGRGGGGLRGGGGGGGAQPPCQPRGVTVRRHTPSAPEAPTGTGPHRT